MLAMSVWSALRWSLLLTCQSCCAAKVQHWDTFAFASVRAEAALAEVLRPNTGAHGLPHILYGNVVS